jgi:hypothetical protein
MMASKAIARRVLDTGLWLMHAIVSSDSAP